MDFADILTLADPAMRVELLLSAHDHDSSLSPDLLRAACDEDRHLFFGVAFRWILQRTGKPTASSRLLVQLAAEEGLLIPLLSGPGCLSAAETQSLLRAFSSAVLGTECVLLEKCAASIEREYVPPGLFHILDAIRDMDASGRTIAVLVRLLRNPIARLRSKVAESLLKLTNNVDTAISLLNDSDDRVRANAVEGLWPQASTKAAQRIFRQFVDSPVPRIAVNALIGLYRGGDPDAASRLIDRAQTGEPPMQRAAIWAMGYLAHEEFEAPLREIRRARTGHLCGPVLRALVQINHAKKNDAAEPDGVDRSHSALGRILATGAAAWNPWRENCREPQPSLEGENFRGMDLTGADLSYCRMRGTNFSDARLDLCNLFGADLRDANFAGASLNRADLRAIETSATTRFHGVGLLGAAVYGAELGGVLLHGFSPGNSSAGPAEAPGPVAHAQLRLGA